MRGRKSSDYIIIIIMVLLRLLRWIETAFVAINYYYCVIDDINNMFNMLANTLGIEYMWG